MTARAALGLVVVAVLAGCLEPQPPLRLQGQAVAPECPAAPGTVPFELLEVGEVSGLARSPRQPCLLWAHDDSGSGPRLYATDARGVHLGWLDLDAGAVDWEDLASFTLDEVPYLLVGDIGNNQRWRGTVALHLVREPDVANLTVPFALRAAPERTIEVRYPSGAFDAEGLAVDVAADQLLLVSKGPSQALHAAPLRQALREGVATLAPLATLPDLGHREGGGLDPGAATGLDLDPAGRAMAVLTYGGAHVWTRPEGQPWADAVGAAPTRIPAPAGAEQLEAIAFSHDGAWLLLGDEQGRPNSRLSTVPAPR